MAQLVDALATRVLVHRTGFSFGYWDNKSTLLSPTLNGCFWYKAAIHQHFLLLFAHSPPDSPLNIVPTTLSFLL